MSLEVRDLQKSFGRTVVCGHLNLQVGRGELVALLGPSGSGKTTLLRILAGLEVPDGGQVLLQGRDAAGLALRERGIGFVFQHYALFPHLSAFENVAFGLRVKPRGQRLQERELHAKVMGLLDRVQLGALAGRLPQQLSGGQRQRVALARALAVDPQLLLLDEPFGALDAQVRKGLRRWLRPFLKDLGITSVLVTHDQDEALEVADRVVVMNQGRIEQVGTPDEVRRAPATPFVRDFLADVLQEAAAV